MPSYGQQHYTVLQDARATATESRQYSSENTRNGLITAFKDAFYGWEPYDWQLDISEALILGLDCILIAETGAGKTMPFIMPLLVDDTKKKMVIVISPLNALETDQACLVMILLQYHLTYALQLGS